MLLKKHTFFLLIVFAVTLHSEMETFDYECCLFNDESQFLRLLFSRDSEFDPKNNPKFTDKFAITWKDIDGWAPEIGTLTGIAIAKVPKFEDHYQLKFESPTYKIILNENYKTGRANGFLEENGERTLLRCNILKI